MGSAETNLGIAYALESSSEHRWLGDQERS
jgi:hypothetical protein